MRIAPAIALSSEARLALEKLSRRRTTPVRDGLSRKEKPGIACRKASPQYLKAGDTIELGIDKLGTQPQAVRETPFTERRITA